MIHKVMNLTAKVSKVVIQLPASAPRSHISPVNV